MLGVRWWKTPQPGEVPCCHGAREQDGTRDTGASVLAAPRQGDIHGRGDKLRQEAGPQQDKRTSLPTAGRLSFQRQGCSGQPMPHCSLGHGGHSSLELPTAGHPAAGWAATPASPLLHLSYRTDERTGEMLKHFVQPKAASQGRRSGEVLSLAKK